MPKVERQFRDLLDEDSVQVPFESMDIQHVVYHEVVYCSLLPIELSFALERSGFYTNLQFPTTKVKTRLNKFKHVKTGLNIF